MKFKPSNNIVHVYKREKAYLPAGAFQNGTSLRGNVASICPRKRTQTTLTALILRTKVTIR